MINIFVMRYRYICNKNKLKDSKLGSQPSSIKLTHKSPT